MLGNHPQRTGDFVANGGFKIGFGMAPKIADVMADLMLEGRDTIPLLVSFRSNSRSILVEFEHGKPEGINS